MAFAYKATITIDHTKVPNTNQTDFPVLVSGTYDGTGTEPDLKSAGNGGNVQNANGYDIYFYSDSALTTRIPAERESYDATTGVIVWWVKVGTVATASDTVIYIAYGDSGISTDPNSDATYGATSTWNTAYKGVWHLPNGTTLGALDSTSNARNGTITGSTAIAGQMDGGANFDGNDDIAISDSVALVYGTGGYSISFWAKGSTAGNQTVYSEAKFSTNVAVFHIGIHGTKFDISIRNNDSVFIWQNKQSSTDASTTVMKHVVWTDSNGTAKMYVDGALDATNFNYTPSATTLDNTYFGAWNRTAGKLWYLTGGVDEIRTSNVVRSADWVTTEYNNQSSPSTFYTMGDETVVSAGPPPGNTIQFFMLLGLGT